MPEHLLTELEKEILELDFTNIRFEQGIILRLKTVVDRSSNLSLLRAKVNRLIIKD